MKKFLKNTLTSMLIIFFILSITNLILQEIQHYFIVTPQIIELAEQVSTTGITPEEGYNLIATVYVAGLGNKLQIQITILVLSILFGIAAGLIYTFEKSSKFKVILYYILGLILVGLIPTLVDIFYYSDIGLTTFFYKILYYLKDFWIWYTLIFIILYGIKMFVSNKKTKQLNEILKNKNYGTY